MNENNDNTYNGIALYIMQAQHAMDNPELRRDPADTDSVAEVKYLLPSIQTGHMKVDNLALPLFAIAKRLNLHLCELVHDERLPEGFRGRLSGINDYVLQDLVEERFYHFAGFAKDYRPSSYPQNPVRKAANYG